MSAYTVLPQIASGPGILLIHPWWGLNETIKGIADRLAREGYLVVAPDLYQGQIARSIAEAEHLRDAMEGEQTSKLLDAALKELAGHPSRSGKGMAVIGLSLGGYYALDLSENQADLVNKVVLFYATGDQKFQQARAAFQGHFAEQDEFEPRENVEALRRSLETAGRPAEFYEYPGTRHWFFEPDRPEYDRQAAELAWQRMLAFLKA